MLTDSFPSRRSTMGLMWCRCSARSRAGKGQTNSILVGEAYFTRIKCPSAPTYRTLNSKWERAEGGNIHQGVVLPLPGIAVYSMYTRSRLQSAREGHLTIMKYTTPDLVEFVDPLPALLLAEQRHQISGMIARLARKL